MARGRARLLLHVDRRTPGDGVGPTAARSDLDEFRLKGRRILAAAGLLGLDLVVVALLLASFPRRRRIVGLMDDDVGVEALGEELQLVGGDGGVRGARGRRRCPERVPRRREQRLCEEIN